MKKIFTLVMLLAPLITFSQASKLISTQSAPRNVSAPNYVWVDLLDTLSGGGGQYRLYVAVPDSVKIKWTQMRWLRDSVIDNWGNSMYAQLLGAYSNPAFVNSLSAAKVFGLSSVALSGAYNDLSGLPNLALYYPYSNPLGFISGITSVMISAALSYTPVSNARTLTINGVSFDLAVNRSWSVGDLLSSGSYSNPTWITSLAYSKLTETPTIPSQLNLSAGTGINVTGTYPNLTVTNSAPDQTVSLTAGQNTKITGSYPNFTVSDSLTTRIYNSSGLVNQAVRMWCDTVTPSTSNGYSINISSAGFTRVLAANVIAIRNTTTAATVPNAAIKTMSTTAITVNVVEDNPATISILGISVLSGLPSIFADVTGLKLAVTVTGY